MAVDRIKAVIFDLDGVLVDAADWHFEALNAALKPFGGEISTRAHHAEFLGLTTSVKVDRLIAKGLLSPGEKEGVLAAKREAFEKIMRRRCVVNEERIQFLKVLRIHGLSLAVASNAGRESVISMLRLSALFPFFEVIVGGDEITNPKPCPDIYEECVSRLGMASSQCLAVEDGHYGAIAANSAGLRVWKLKSWSELTLTSAFKLIRHPQTNVRISQLSRSCWLSKIVPLESSDWT